MTVKKKVKEKVRQSQLGLMIKLVSSKVPFDERPTYGDLAKCIEEEFNVICSADDIVSFYDLDRDMEDVRLIYENAGLA